MAEAVAHRHVLLGARASRIGLALGALLAVGAGAVHLASRGGEEAPQVESAVPRRVEGAIEVGPAFREQAGIEVTRVGRTAIAPLVRVVGEAAFDPTHVAAVGTRAQGVVTQVFHVEGDVVERGAVLAEIESPKLVDVQAELRVALARRRAAVLDMERERSLLARGLTTAREFEQARASAEQQRALLRAAQEQVDALGGGRSQMGLSRLRAPVAGVIAERAISPGQNVGDALIAFRVGDVDQLWVVLRVFERHIELVRTGDPVVIRPPGAPGREIQGKVAHVGSVIDPLTRTTDVRVEVDNRARALRPGQSVSATIRASGPARTVLALPASAVTYVDGAPTVFVAESPTRFAPRKVELGLDGGDVVEIVRGVQEGEEVVSASVVALKSELFR